MPSRRAFLTAAATASVTSLVAGCLGRREEPSQSPTPTPTTIDEMNVPKRLPWGESGTVDGTAVTPESAWVQQSTLTLTSPDTMGVVSAGDRQFLFVRVSVTQRGSTPAVEDFEVTAGASTVTGRTSVESVEASNVLPDKQASAYHPEVPTGWLAFPLPDALSGIDAATLAVQFGGETEGQLQWPLPDSVVGALGRAPPALTVESVHIPEPVPADEPFDVTYTVSNEGGLGVFRAAVNEVSTAYIPHPIRLPVGAGETASASATIETHVRSGTSEIRLELVTANGSKTRTVQVDS